MKSFLRFFVLVCLLLAIAAALLWPKRSDFLARGLEKWISQTQSELFIGPVDVQGLELSPGLFIKIKSMRGIWRTQEGSFPFELRDIQVAERITHFLLGRPVNISFGQFRPANSQHAGVSGRVTLYNDPGETFELKADFYGLDLEELAPFNPEVLSKSSGKLTGDILVKAHKAGTEKIKLSLNVTPPGGRLPAYFFDMLLPYLPPAEKEALSQIRTLKSVKYESAQVTAELAEKDALKILLKIKVPAYNVNLNLNLTIRVEDNTAFSELAKLMGLIKVGVS
ncbi:MAG: hypothetical protein Q8R76_10240 [Candidatus Omnitrophota bacterium]|nr:hypothetical protein [Candidatus Omnitrophota bacterium]